MAMVVNHNIPALQTYNTVNRTNNALEKSIQKLSTGLRINSAADDAAGLAISEKMRAQVNGMDRAVSNAQDGISMIQTAEGALNETHSILQRMRELAVQASNDTLTSQDRSYIQLEIDELRDEVTRIGNTTQFNKKKLLNGDAAVLWSSDDLETKAIVNGGLRSLDQFGQKVVTEGNYRIKVKATAGQGEVQKSDLFRIKHDVDPWYATATSVFGISASDKQKTPDIKGGGTYAISGTVLGTGETQEAEARLHAQTGGASKISVDVSSTSDIDTNAYIKFRVKSVNIDETDPTKNTLVLSYEGNRIGKDGKVDTKKPLTGELTLKQNTENTDLKFAANNQEGLKIKIEDIATSKVGEEFVVTVNAAGEAEKDAVVKINAKPDSGDADNYTYTINKAQATDTTSEFKVAYLETDADDPDYEAIQEGSVYMTTNNKFNDNVNTGDWVTYRKGVTIPEDGEDDWLKGTLSAVTNVTTSEGLPSGDGVWYKIKANAEDSATEIAAGNGSVSVMEGSADATSANTLKGLIEGAALNNATPGTGVKAKANASGYLKITVSNAGAGSTAGTSTAKIQASFVGTTTDGKVVRDFTSLAGSSSLVDVSTAEADATTKTGLALKFGDADLGTFNTTTGALGGLKNGDYYFLINAAADSGGSANVNLTGNLNASKDTPFAGDDAPAYRLKKTVDTFELVAAVRDDPEKTIADLNWADNSEDFQTITVKIDGGTNANLEDGFGKSLATLTWGKETTAKVSSTIGELAGSKTSLYDLEKFWDSQGVFMLTEPQTLTLTQGDGKQASITLYKDDTIGSMVKKLNNAIANDLGQGKYVDDASHFVSFVDQPTDAGDEAVQGTMLIRTVVPGSSGTIRFSGNEDVINALSLNTIQDATESKYTVSIEDAHTGKTVVNETQVTGNKLVGALHPNVDVEFSAMKGISAEWDDVNKTYKMKADTEANETILHLTDNTTVFQIGANEGEDMGVHIGDMRAQALGLNRVLVTDRASASHSITLIDNAIDKVSTQRARLGAYQNRLEHTINNLSTASENITAAESRIRDTDMAKEMMNFTKLQIMLQAGTSMLAQANQLPQNVMALVR